MGDASIVLWSTAFILGALTLRKGRDQARIALGDAGERFLVVMPRIAVALIMAGFVGKLVPGRPIADLIGFESGLSGILIASLVGGFVPAGPIVAFPLVVVLYTAGAGMPQLVAFLTAWSVFAFHRILMYEITFMGWRFSAVRFASSLILPALSGITAQALATWMNVS